jgi:RimJ/RimL family protein N-acetyltransferase
VSTFAATRIESDGFTLRPLDERDVDDITAACQDAETLAWLPLPMPYLREHATGFVSQIAPAALASGAGIVFGIEVDGRLQGCIDLKATDWRSLTTEIGYWVAPWGRGQGLAGRATRVLAEWALREHGLERVVVRAATGNAASQRAAERAGFVREGVARNAGFVHAGRVDLVVYSLIRSELGLSMRAVG